MNIDENTLYRAAVVVVVGGLILLGLTYILPILIPIVAVLLVIYLAYRYFTTGRLF